MLPKEFKLTILVIEKLNEYVHHVYYSDLLDSNPLLEIKLDSDNKYLSLIDELEDTFKDELSSLEKDRSIFYGCANNLYMSSYSSLLESYLHKNINTTEIDFLEFEINNMVKIKDYIKESYISDYSKSLQFGIKNQLRFLNDKCNEIGYKVSKINNRIKLTKIVDFKSSTIDLVSDEVLFRERSLKEWIVLLNELGVIKFLFSKYDSNVNKTALALSLLINAKQTTLQSYINPLLHLNNDDKNSPYRTNKIKNSIQIELRDKKLM